MSSFGQFFDIQMAIFRSVSFYLSHFDPHSDALASPQQTVLCMMPVLGTRDNLLTVGLLLLSLTHQVSQAWRDSWEEQQDLYQQLNSHIVRMNRENQRYLFKGITKK